MKLVTRMKRNLVKNRVLVGIIFVAFFLRFVGLTPNIVNADESYTQTISWDLVNSIITKGDINPHSFKYGSLMFYSQATTAFPVLVFNYFLEGLNTTISSSSTSHWLGFSAFYDEAIRKYANTLVLFGRAQTAFFGTLSVYVLYLITKKLFNKRTAYFASFLFAVAPLHVRDSHYITTDVLSLLSILIAFLFALYMIDTRKTKWFVLTGIAMGISTTIRYYPIAFAVYPLALLFSCSKSLVWLKNVILSIFFVFVGVFIGIPFFFLDPSGPTLFMEDLQKYALPWYSTPLSTYALSILNSITSGGEMASLDIDLLYQAPKNFRPIHSSWLLFNGFGFLPTFASILGSVYLLLKSSKKFLLVILIPLANLIYISSFIPSSYERLVIPTIPFMAILAAVFLTNLKISNKKIYWLIVISVLIFPFMKSKEASYACSQKKIQDMSVDWVGENISADSSIGYLTMVAVPPVNYKAWEALEPRFDLSLEEARNIGLDHAFINAGRLDYNTYEYFNGFLIVPPEIYENSYYSLILSEYASRGELLGRVRKPWMCDYSRIYYYKLPEKYEERKVATGDLKNWKINSPDITGTAAIEQEGKLLKYKQTPYGFTAPRVVSDNFLVDKDQIYTFSFKIKTDGVENVETKVLARIDFYENGRTTLFEKLEELQLLFNEGSTQLLFEKRREYNRTYSNTDLPGMRVALSPIVNVNSEWQEVSITAKTPEGSTFATFSIQPISSRELTLYVDEIDVKR